MLDRRQKDPTVELGQILGEKERQRLESEIAQWQPKKQKELQPIFRVREKIKR